MADKASAKAKMTTKPPSTNAFATSGSSPTRAKSKSVPPAPPSAEFRMNKLPSLEKTLARVARVSKMGDKIASITRARKPTKAQKKLLLTFFAGMEQSLRG